MSGRKKYVLLSFKLPPCCRLFPSELHEFIQHIALVPLVYSLSFREVPKGPLFKSTLNLVCFKHTKFFIIEGGK